jgi:hypothetical protein
VNSVPISDEVKSLTAIVTGPVTQSAQDVVAISSANPIKGFKVASTGPCGGVAPLAISFMVTVTGLDMASLQGIEVDFNGDGTIDYAATDMTQDIGYTYSVPGIYTARFTLRANDGTSYGVDYLVQVQDLATAQQPFQSLLASVQSALLAGNIPHALTYFASGSQARYAEIFQVVKPQLPAMIATWSNIQPIMISDKYAQYSIQRLFDGTMLGFSVVFIKDEGGVWKINSM